ncbi:MAG: tRNA dihydrouridine synthase DusB [Peptococcaceae bacterium]|nr:tRNA dihydrouridine synthase DusB [Peptococcaceae bacterium]
MKLGDFILNNLICSAPMAGVTDKAYRFLAREMGCDMLWTEMVSATALTYANSKTLQILDITGEIQPVVVQIFGSDPVTMARAATIVVERGAKIIDINMGCPAPKIVKNCEGSALLKNLPLAGKIASAVVEAVDVPVTVKFRLGWDASNLNGKEMAKVLEGVGVAAVIVHGRTRDQFYSGKADWGAIAEIKNSVGIPVIGNGDIWEPQDAQKMLETTGCDGVMIGRGSLGNPWIFNRTAQFLATGELQPPPSATEKIIMAKRHFSLLLEHKTEWVAVQEMRKHAAWYVKGLREAARIRDLVMATKTATDMLDVLDRYCFSLTDLGA